MCQSNNSTQFSIINNAYTTGKIYFKGEFIDSIKYQVLNDSINHLEDWNACRCETLHLEDTIFPKKDCTIYIKAFSGEIEIPHSAIEINYNAILIGMLQDFNPKVFDMLVVDPSNPLKGTKLIVDSMRFQSTAIYSRIVQRAIQHNFEIALELYEDSIPLTSSKLPKIKRIEFIKPKEK